MLKLCSASAYLALALLTASGAVAQQGREGQQRRPSQPGPEEVVTALFQQEGVPYWVSHYARGQAEACHVMMADKASRTFFAIETDGGDRTAVIVLDLSEPRRAPFATVGARQTLRVEVAGIAQSYSIKTKESKDEGWAEAVVPRAALPHLRAAVNSRDGLVVKVGDAAPIQFAVPPKAADVFHECGRGILRGRMDDTLERLRRSYQR